MVPDNRDKETTRSIVSNDYRRAMVMQEAMSLFADLRGMTPS